MRIHYLQHAPFEGLGMIATWAQKQGHDISGRRLYANELLPTKEEHDWLIVLGGPMNIYEEDKYPWLVSEKRFIDEALRNKKKVLGICLGSQLIADVLGAKVKKNHYKEIGWYPVIQTNQPGKVEAFRGLPPQFMAFHWHGDTFELPHGTEKLAQSEGCANQAFAYNNQALGLQFHLEFSKFNIEKLIETCGEELTNDKFVQSEQEILGNIKYIENMQVQLEKLLGTFLVEQEN